MVTPPGAYEILNTKLDAVASTLGEVRAKVDDFSAAIVVQARLEERQAQATEALARAFGVIAEHQTQLDALQRALPPLVETRRWVVAGIGLAVSAVLAAMIKTAVLDPATLRDEVNRAVAERAHVTQPK